MTEIIDKGKQRTTNIVFAKSGQTFGQNILQQFKYKSKITQLL